MTTNDEKKLIEKFIYSCSHELRGPVAAIQGLVRLSTDYPQQIDPNECIKMIGECSNKLDNLIRSLQNYMVNEHRKIQMERVNAQQLGDETISLHREELAEMSVRIETDVNVSGDWIVDRYRVSEIIHHLVSNAITFSDPKKKKKMVLIKIESSVDTSSITVSDNGLGIAKNAQLKVFDIFCRANAASKGSGMGLFLVRQLAHKIGGQIYLDSAEGFGTSVKIRLQA